MGTMFMALVLFGSSALGVAISLALVTKYALDREPGSGEQPADPSGRAGGVMGVAAGAAGDGVRQGG